MGVEISFLWVRAPDHDNESMGLLPEGWPVPRVGEVVELYGAGNTRSRSYEVKTVIHVVDRDEPGIDVCIEPLPGGEAQS